MSGTVLTVIQLGASIIAAIIKALEGAGYTREQVMAAVETEVEAITAAEAAAKAKEQADWDSRPVDEQT